MIKIYKWIKLTTGVVLFSIITGTAFGQTTINTVFFSEYVEGNFINKALEIFNGSESTINLSEFSIQIYYRGSDDIGATHTLRSGTLVSSSETLAPGEVYVLATRDASTSYAIRDQEDEYIFRGVGSFAGNDGLALVHNGVIVDWIGGNIGSPGSDGLAWPVAGVYYGTADQTLVRKQSITQGNAIPEDSFGTTVDNSEWIVYDRDEFRYLGTHCTIPSQATGVTFGTTGATSMVVNWVKGDGEKSLVVVKEGSAVNRTPALGTDYTAGTTVFSDGEATLGVGNDNVVVYSNDSNEQTVTVTGLTPESTYYVAVYAYNAVRFCYNTESPAIGFKSTTPIDGNSDITAVGGEATTAIEYFRYQRDAVLTENRSVSLFTFSINDNTGTDVLPTIVTEISFDITNYENLKTLALFDGAMNIAELAVGSNTVTFMLDPTLIVAPNGSSKEVNVRATFSDNVDDGEQIGLTISAVSAASSDSSTFVATNGAPPGGSGVTTNLSGSTDTNAIAVTATELAIEALDQVQVGAAFEVAVTAVDVLGNTDVAARNVTLSRNTGTGTLASVEGLGAKAMDNGVYTWDDLMYEVAEPLRVSVTDTPGTLSAISEDINVVVVNATKFVIQAPDEVQVGTRFRVVVTAVDDFGNTDLAAREVILSRATGTGTLTPATELGPVAMTDGVYTWRGLRYDEAETLTLSITDTPETLSATKDIDMWALLTSVFFSEYIEGDEDNKALEIYNGSEDAVDLTEFSISKKSNSPTGPSTYSLEGILPAGEVYVLGNERAGSEILNQVDARDNFFDFNGGDWVALLHNEVIVDLIGDNGFSFASSWQVGSTLGGTADHTLVRRQIVTQGNATPLGSFGTTVGNNLEWDIYDQNEFRYLGSHCDLPIVQATNVVFGDTDDTSMVVNWTKGDGDQSLVVVKAVLAVDAMPIWNTNYTLASADFSAGKVTLGDNVVVYSGNMETVTVTGLTSGTIYHVAVYAYNSARFCYNTVSPAIDFKVATTDAADSNISAVAGGETASIEYLTYQKALNLTQRTSASLFTFSINDTGTGDALSTTVNAISFDITNYENLRTLALFDGTADGASLIKDWTWQETLQRTPYLFTNLSIKATSGSNKEVNVRATFLTDVDDGDRIRLTISAATAAATGSVFATNNGGGAATIRSNQIEVTATALAIRVPELVKANASFMITVTAVDVHGNTDVAARSVTLGDFSGLNLASSGLTVQMVNGVYTWGSLLFFRAEITTVSVTDSPGVLFTTSGNIIVVNTLPVLTVAGSLTNFGSVNNGATSTVQSFTVVGENLVSNITVTAPTGFEVSLAAGTGFSASVDLAEESGALGLTTIYVRFAPKSGINGSVTADIVLSGTGVDETISVTGTETGNTVVVTSNAADSNISAVAGGETASIEYLTYQKALDLTQRTSASLFTFSINDTGTGDALSTTVNAISFDITNHQYLRTLALFDGTADGASLIKELDVAGNIATNTLPFTDLLIEATPGSNKEVNVRATFLTDVNDGDQIGLTISTVTAAATGSTFAALNGGGAATTGSSNQIEVTATELVITAPELAQLNKDFELTVTAVDLHGNTDVATREVTLSRATGTGTLASSAGLGSVAMTAGVYIWNDLQYDVAEIITVSVTDNTALLPLSATSEEINVWALLTSVFFSEYIEGDEDNKALEIYNSSGDDVDLTQFAISRYVDGGSMVAQRYRLRPGRSLNAGDVYVIGNSNAVDGISNQADVSLVDGIMSFDGNDGIALLHNGVLVDLIGNNDGVGGVAGWSVAGDADATVNHTLVRKQSVTEGNPTPLASFASEWTVKDVNDFSYLGSHCDLPSTQARSVTFGATEETSMVVDWIKNTAGNPSLVVVKASSEVDATPIWNTDYTTATAVFSAREKTLGRGNDNVLCTAVMHQR